MKKNKYRKLAINTIIFTIGSFGSKVLSFIIVPLYTFVLTTEEFGIVDLYSTTLSLMIPFTTLVIYEGIIRYLTTNEITNKQAISSGFLVFLFGACISIAGTPIYCLFIGTSEYIWLFIVTLIFNTYNQIFSNYLRANNKNIAFSINGIIVVASTVFFNLFFLIVLKIGLKGYLYSLLIAQIMASIQVTIQGKILNNIDFKSLSKKILIKHLKYCVPLIPNGLMWWIMNAADKYLINYYLGSSYNGIYALSMKFPSVLNLVYSIFMQAWQLSAIEEGKNKNSSEFYSNVFIFTTAALTFISSLIILFIKPLFSVVIDDSFSIAWQYVPFLCIAGMFSCTATFMGVVYMIEEKSYKSFFTTFIGALVNLLLSWILIERMGLYGVAIGTGIGYLVVAIIRIIDANKSIHMQFYFYKVILSILILILQGILIIRIETIYSQICGFVLLFILILIYYKEFINLLCFFKRNYLDIKR